MNDLPKEYISPDELIKKGVEIIETRGSVLFCGLFSNPLLTGVNSIIRLKIRLGCKMPSIAAAFYIASRKSDG
jgi:hypothetical protein